MNEANIKRLKRRFPFLYRRTWDFGCGDGWFNLIWDLSLQIERRLDISEFGKLKERVLDWLSFQWKRILIMLFGYHYNIVYRLWWDRRRGFAVEQIKEKFGVLNYNVSGGDEQIFDLTMRAMDLSSTICETCGRPGRTMRHADWIYTACFEHTKEEDRWEWDRH